MSNAERFEAEPSYPPPKQGMSTGLKILLGCGIGCGVLTLLCCGGMVAGTWWSMEMLKRSVVREPAEIQAIADAVATIDVPAGLRPKAGVDMRIPIVDRTFLKAVAFTDDHDHQILAIGEFSESFAQVDEDSLRDEINRALADGSKGEHDHDDFQVQETHQLELEIRGQPAKFRIEEGVDKDQKKLIRAMGDFQGHHGLGLVFLQLDAEQYNLEQVEQILRSIR
jgi:hypothetical protein